MGNTMNKQNIKSPSLLKEFYLKDIYFLYKYLEETKNNYINSEIWSMCPYGGNIKYKKINNDAIIIEHTDTNYHYKNITLKKFIDAIKMDSINAKYKLWFSEEMLCDYIFIKENINVKEF